MLLLQCIAYIGICWNGGWHILMARIDMQLHQLGATDKYATYWILIVNKCGRIETVLTAEWRPMAHCNWSRASAFLRDIPHLDWQQMALTRYPSLNTHRRKAVIGVSLRRLAALQSFTTCCSRHVAVICIFAKQTVRSTNESG